LGCLSPKIETLSIEGCRQGSNEVLQLDRRALAADLKAQIEMKARLDVLLEPDPRGWVAQVDFPSEGMLKIRLTMKDGPCLS
jgi:hypothetical protein